MLEVLTVDPQGEDALTLLREAALEASKLYPEYHDPSAAGPSNSPNAPRGVYLVAYLDSRPVGMAAHRPLDENTTEVRRMYVKTSQRRAGIARELLLRIEEHASSQGFRFLVLETGNRQIPAIQLYLNFGFTRIAPFGAYKNDPTSVCFRKLIRRGEASAA
jgi:GNAT superfamily N-acetyltransferase